MRSARKEGARRSSVVVVEDDARVRAAVRQLLAPERRYRLVGEAGTVAAGIALARKCKPHVLLLDLCLPDGTGADVLRALRVDKPRPIVFVLTVLEDAEHMFDALLAGARGYLLKEKLADRLVPALDDACAGGASMSAGVTPRALGTFADSSAPRSSAIHAALTAREREVTELLARGSSYDEIGRTLYVSTNTVRTFIRRIYEKLRVSSKTGAVREAVRLGYVRMPRD